MTLDEAIKHCEEKAEEQEYVSRIIVELHREDSEREHKAACDACAAKHHQLAEWLRELKELKKLTVISPVIAGYNEVYEKLRKGDIEASNDKDLLKTAVDTLENVMPKYRRLSEENQKQKEQIAEYKRLLRLAVEDIVWLNEHTVDVDGGCLIETATDIETCLACPLNVNNSHLCGWKHQVDALALIGEDGENDA